MDDVSRRYATIPFHAADPPPADPYREFWMERDIEAATMQMLNRVYASLFEVPYDLVAPTPVYGPHPRPQVGAALRRAMGAVTESESCCCSCHDSEHDDY